MVRAPQQTLMVGELRTGRRLVSIPVSACSWSIAAGAAGSIEATIPLLATDFQRLSARAVSGQWPLDGMYPAPGIFPQQSVTRWAPDGRSRRDIGGVTEPTRMFAAVLAGDRVIEAGPIWARTWGQGTLTIRATGLSSIFDHRLLLSHLIDWSAPGAIAASSLSYSGLSLGTIAKRLVQAALAHSGGDLPIVLPDDEAGTHERTYPGSDLATVAQRLQQLAEVQGGPEYAFEPRLTADRMGIEWMLRVGTTADPALHQDGLDWVVDTSAPRGQVSGFTVTEDASAVATRAFAKGSGTDTAALISRPSARADLLDSGYPLLESARSYSTVLEQSTIDAHAAADLATNDRPWTTWSLSLVADDRLGQVRPGDWWQVRVGEHVYLERGTYRARMASLKGAFGSSTIDLGMVPMEVAG